MDTAPLKYYLLFGDSDNNHEFYYGKEAELQFARCGSCKKVLNREAVIQQAVPLYKARFSRLFYQTHDGVTIVSQRFVDIYQQYQLNGLAFTLLPKLKNYYLLNCTNTVCFDVAASPGFESGRVCPACGRPDGAWRPFPYKMHGEDEQELRPFTFYQSDIEFGDKYSQSPLLFATEDILHIFQKEGGRIFFETAENGKAKQISC